VKALLVIGVLLVVFVVACGEVHFEAWSVDKPTPTTSVGASYGGATSYVVPATPAGLGDRARTAADVRWIHRMNLLCARRNRMENSLPGPDYTLRSLARYSAQTHWIWDDYERRAASLRVPATYAREAAWVKQVDSAKGQGIQTVAEAARTQNGSAALGIKAFEDLSRSVSPGLTRIGLARCVRFHP
jgi:hypothetical protein